MGYNILADTYLDNTTSGISNYSQVRANPSQMSSLINLHGSLTIASGQVFGLLAEMGMDLVCDKAVIYCDQPFTSGVAEFHYKEFLENRWVSDGAYNYNTDYATPIMSSNVDPDPYTCSGTTAWDATWYAAYKAFNQTANDSLDCWMSGQGASGYVPQSVMFHFPYGKMVNKFALQARNSSVAADRGFPTYFSLQGNTVDNPSVSNDSHWTTLSTQSGVVDPGQAGWTDYFTFQNSQSYTYYRLKIMSGTVSNHFVALANLKLVEANRPESVPVCTWHVGQMQWDTDHYVYNIGPETGIQEAQFFLGSLDETITISGVSLAPADGVVSISGTVASGIYVDSYILTARTLDPLLLQIRNHMDGWAQPHLLFDYTGVFDIDRNIFISPDYPQCYNKDEAVWYSLDSGITIPEKDDFGRGIFDGTQLVNRKVLLSDDTVEGTWRSVVFDSHGKDTAAYLYTSGGPQIFVRASDTPPSPVTFMILSTDPSHRWLMYDHKRCYIDALGQTIGFSTCDSPSNGSKMWRYANQDWAATDLMYYGSINDLGTACFVAPGYTDCADISPEQEFTNPDFWYNVGLCTMDSDEEWNVGTTISGLPYGSKVQVVMTKTFPVSGSNGFFCFSVTSDEDLQKSSLNLSFHQDGVTRGSYPLLSMQGTIAPGTRVDIAYDQANNGWWAYIGQYVYKVDAGSINNVRIFSGSDGTTEVKDPDEIMFEGQEEEAASGPEDPTDPNIRIPDTLQGYIWRLEAPAFWKGIVSIPSERFSFFWAYDETTIYLYEEVYDADVVDLALRATITMGVQVESGFLELHQGSCDSYGNLWILDMMQERVLRVNLQKALVGDSRAVEYENQVAGVIGLWAHPTDDTCYLLISNEPEHANQDIIRMVHVNQRWGSQGKYVCAVPGFSSYDYRYGVNFVGKAFLGGVRPHRDDPVWGTEQYDIRGSQNTSTDYATPKMYGDFSPTPFKVMAASSSIGGWASPGYPYMAFDRVVSASTATDGVQTGWRAGNDSRIMFVFDEPILINKYDLGITFRWSKATNLVTIFQAYPPPTAWKFYGVKDEYADSFSVSNDTHWDLLDTRTGVVPPYYNSSSDVTVSGAQFNPWYGYFACVNTKKRIAYRLSITASTVGGAAALGQLKLVEAQEKIPWRAYTNGDSMPRGRYKQIRVDFSRASVKVASPRLEKLRIPSPIILEPLAKGQETKIALKTTFNKVRTPGAWDPKLKVWWYDEEI